MNDTIRDIANLIDSGLVGIALVKELRARFPHAKRDEVFMAIGIAVTLKAADLMIYESDVAA
jgi:hypothetical protein